MTADYFPANAFPADSWPTDYWPDAKPFIPLPLGDPASPTYFPTAGFPAYAYPWLFWAIPGTGSGRTWPILASGVINGRSIVVVGGEQ